MEREIRRSRGQIFTILSAGNSPTAKHTIAVLTSVHKLTIPRVSSYMFVLTKEKSKAIENRPWSVFCWISCRREGGGGVWSVLWWKLKKAYRTASSGKLLSCELVNSSCSVIAFVLNHSKVQYSRVWPALLWTHAVDRVWNRFLWLYYVHVKGVRG